MIRNGPVLQTNYPKTIPRYLFNNDELNTCLRLNINLFSVSKLDFFFLNVMLAYLKESLCNYVIIQWMQFMFQLGNHMHFSIGLVYCLHMYTFILFNITHPVTLFLLITLLNCISILFNCFAFQRQFVMLGYTGNEQQPW